MPSSWEEEEDDEGRCEGRREVLPLKREEHSVERERIKVEKADTSAAEGSDRDKEGVAAIAVMVMGDRGSSHFGGDGDGGRRSGRSPLPSDGKGGRFFGAQTPRADGKTVRPEICPDDERRQGSTDSRRHYFSS